MKKKNVLLCTARPPDESPFFTTEKRPPMGLLFMATILREKGHNVFFLDNYARPKDFVSEGYLQANKIDVVALYCNTICWRDCNNILAKINHLKVDNKWNGKVIIGGPHVSVNFSSISLNLVDYVVRGEGESLIASLVEGNVKGNIHDAKRIKDLDSLAVPAWDLVAGDKAYNWDCVFMPGLVPVFPMSTSRGCPYDCSFCSSCCIWGNTYTTFSPKRVVEDMFLLQKEYKAQGIYFREDNFTADKKRVEKICNLLINKESTLKWACESRVDTLTKKLLTKMKKAGCVGLYIGVESGSQKVLDALNKKIKVSKIRDIFKYCNELGIKTACSLIRGTPGETEEDIKLTDSLVKDIKPTVVWENVFVGLPGSKLYSDVIESGDYDFIDDRGMVYLKGHNDRVEKYYGNHPLKWSTKIPPAKSGTPLVSVVMSAYNVKDYLEEAVSSILNQSYANFEFLIVDDKSTDGTRELLKTLQAKDYRIRVFNNPYNCGLTKNLNNLIKTAKGKYIARMDADDISLPNRFEEQVRFLEANQDYGVVGSSYYHVNMKSVIIKWVNVLCKHSSLVQGLQRQNWFAHGSVMMNKGHFMTTGLYDERFKYAQDYDLFRRMAVKFKIANLPVPYYCYRIRPDNISAARNKEQDQFAQMARGKKL